MIRHSHTGEQILTGILRVPSGKCITVPLRVRFRQVISIVYRGAVRLRSFIRIIMIGQRMLLQMILVNNRQFTLRVCLKTVYPGAFIKCIAFKFLYFRRFYRTVRIRIKIFRLRPQEVLSLIEFINSTAFHFFRFPFRIRLQILCRHRILGKFLGQRFIQVPAVHMISLPVPFFGIRPHNRSTI